MRTILLFLVLLRCDFNSSAQVNLTAGLMAHYPFDGSTADASGQGNHAVNYGAVATTDQSGNPASAYFFDGVNDFMQVASAASLNVSQFTLSARVYPTGYYSGNCYNNMILGKLADDNGQAGNYSMRFYPAATNGNCFAPDTLAQNFRVDAHGGCFTASISSAPYVVTNKWHCVVGSYDGTTLRTWVDGALRFQCALAANTGSNTSDLLIGKFNAQSYPYWFKGKLDDIRIYNRALNPEEVEALCRTNTDGVASIQAAAPPIQVYPSPSSGLIYIEATSAEFPMPYTIFNSLGQTVKQGWVESAGHPIDVKMLTPGVYGVHANGKDQQPVLSRFMKL